jgi:hypothetical protein
MFYMEGQCGILLAIKKYLSQPVPQALPDNSDKNTPVKNTP